MYVTLKEQGGFGAAALRQRPPLEVDVDDRGDAAVAHVREMIEAARPAASDPPDAGRASSARSLGGMSYIVTIHDEGRETVLRFDDASLTNAADDLIVWIKQHC